MSGTYRRLRPGRYHLVVKPGAGPAGVRRPDGDHVAVGVEGGLRDFAIHQHERVYYWWRGPEPRSGVRLEKARAQPRRLPAVLSRGAAAMSRVRGARSIP